MPALYFLSISLRNSAYNVYIYIHMYIYIYIYAWAQHIAATHVFHDLRLSWKGSSLQVPIEGATIQLKLNPTDMDPLQGLWWEPMVATTRNPMSMLHVAPHTEALPATHKPKQNNEGTFRIPWAPSSILQQDVLYADVASQGANAAEENAARWHCRCSA